MLAVSLGDPAGIGPELIAACHAAHSADDLPAFAVTGGAGVLRRAAQSRDLAIEVREVADWAEAAAVFPYALPVIGHADADCAFGAPDDAGARLALGSLDAAMAAVRCGAAGGLVTAPIAKGRLARVGFEFPGQTEYCAAACNVAFDDTVMMLAGPSLRAVPLTIHIALRDVPDRLTANLIYRRARVVAAALRDDFGIEQPRLAVCGLNPHAGEDGRMGDEEARIIAPAIAGLQREGIDISGPHPADTMFAPRARATYDAALAMYHDQALVPLKALDFDEGVNVTLGLPVVRTSPDHGTAFDIAGKGVADPGAMRAAIRMAGEMVSRRAKVRP